MITLGHGCPAKGNQENYVGFAAGGVVHDRQLDGRGIAWLPKSLIDEELAANQLAPAASHEWYVDLEIRLYRDRKPMGRVAEALWDVVSQTGAQTK